MLYLSSIWTEKEGKILPNDIPANQYLPLYYINGKIKQVSWTIPIRINK